jgi:hypothetical protein
MVTDPERLAYRRLGLERVNWIEYFRPRVLWGYLRILWHGGKVRKPSGEEDLHQLGGDFIFDRSLRLIFAWRSRDPIDRPAPEELLRVLRSLQAKDR